MAALLITLGLFLAAPGIAKSAGPLPPTEAETALAEGLKAAERQEWEAAIDAFSAALHQGDARSPKVNYFLALAFDKAGGRDLQAIARYRAFLALAPDTPRGGEIRQRVALLETRAADNLRNLVTLAEQALNELDSSALGNFAMTEGVHRPLFKAKLWLGNKEHRELLESAMIQNDVNQFKLTCLGLAYADLGDYRKAEKIANELVQHHFQLALSLHREIANKKFGAGDTVGALASVAGSEELITSRFTPPPSTLLAESAGLRAGFGDLAGAERVLNQAIKLATGVPPDAFFEGVAIGGATNQLALAYFRAGELAKAEALIAQLLERGNSHGHDQVIMAMAWIYARRGESELALSTGKRLRESSTPDDFRKFIEEQAWNRSGQVKDEFGDWLELLNSYPLNKFSRDLRVLLKEAGEGDEMSQLWFKMVGGEKGEHPEEPVRRLAALAGDYMEALQVLDKTESGWRTPSVAGRNGRNGRE